MVMSPHKLGHDSIAAAGASATVPASSHAHFNAVENFITLRTMLYQVSVLKCLYGEHIHK